MRFKLFSSSRLRCADSTVAKDTVTPKLQQAQHLGIFRVDMDGLWGLPCSIRAVRDRNYPAPLQHPLPPWCPTFCTRSLVILLVQVRERTAVFASQREAARKNLEVPHESPGGGPNFGSTGNIHRHESPDLQAIFTGRCPTRTVSTSATLLDSRVPTWTNYEAKPRVALETKSSLIGTLT